MIMLELLKPHTKSMPPSNVASILLTAVGNIKLNILDYGQIPNTKLRSEQVKTARSISCLKQYVKFHTWGDKL